MATVSVREAVEPENSSSLFFICKICKYDLSKDNNPDISNMYVDVGYTEVKKKASLPLHPSLRSVLLFLSFINLYRSMMIYLNVSHGWLVGCVERWNCTQVDKYASIDGVKKPSCELHLFWFPVGLYEQSIIFNILFYSNELIMNKMWKVGDGIPTLCQSPKYLRNLCVLNVLEFKRLNTFVIRVSKTEYNLMVQRVSISMGIGQLNVKRKSFE